MLVVCCLQLFFVVLMQPPCSSSKMDDLIRSTCSFVACLIDIVMYFNLMFHLLVRGSHFAFPCN